MGILDAYLEMADAQSLATNTGGTYQVGDIINLGVASPNIGAGTSIFWKAVVGTAVTGAGGTLTLTLQHSTTGTGSWATLIGTGNAAATTGDYTAGSVVEHIALPITAIRRYIRTVFTNSSTVTVGTLDSVLELTGDNV